MRNAAFAILIFCALWLAYVGSRPTTVSSSPLSAPAPVAPAPPSQESLARPRTPPQQPTLDLSFGYCPEAGVAEPAVKRPSLIASAERARAAGDTRFVSAFKDLLAADRVGDTARAIGALRVMSALSPHDPAVHLALGRHLATTSELEAARAALSSYLERVPSDASIAQLVARLGTQEEIEGAYARREHRGLELRWPSELGVDAESILELIDASLDEASRLLRVPRRQSLRIVIYPTRSELLATTCVPPWSAGVYDGTLRLVADLMTSSRERQRLVRHEILHAALGVAAPRAPVWFHEGVAQWFAKEAGPAHERTFARMVENETYAPFASLEGSFMVFDADEDAGLVYHQSLAMVELMLEQGGEGALAQAVEKLALESEADRIQAPLAGALRFDEGELLAYLRRRAKTKDPR